MLIIRVREALGAKENIETFMVSGNGVSPSYSVWCSTQDTRFSMGIWKYIRDKTAFLFKDGNHITISIDKNQLTSNFKKHIRGAFNKVPDFFGQVFKIVVDPWKFSMLLLYILWDDWSTFMIGQSSHKVQINSYSSNWNVTAGKFQKMLSGHEDTLEER